MMLVVALLALGAVAAPDGKRCRSAAECPAHWSCSSPEELRMNWCGKRSLENDCGPGEVADSCGACFKACTGVPKRVLNRAGSCSLAASQAACSGATMAP